MPNSPSNIVFFFFLAFYKQNVRLTPAFRDRFNLFHENVYGDSPESANIRYGAEVKRVAGVLDGVLAQSEWLVGDKCTYADLAFTMWNMQIAFVMSSRTGEHAWNTDEFPHFTRWQNACLGRESVKKVISVLNDKEVKSS